MEDDSDNTLIGWILGIAVALSVTIALLAGVVGLNAGSEAPATAAPASTPLVAKVYFDSGVTALPADGAAALAPVVDALKANAAARIAISGYHDKTGNPEQNAELAKQRAFAVRDALGAAGVADTRITLRKPQEAQGDGNDREARRVEATVE
ncbi:MAG: OmpA family protein [Burkholderiales bacterium]|nr:OmpA family protein [Burkholderiales bacterium]